MLNEEEPYWNHRKKTEPWNRPNIYVTPFLNFFLRDTDKILNIIGYEFKIVIYNKFTLCDL